jgi:hypothetical protein
MIQNTISVVRRSVLALCAIAAAACNGDDSIVDPAAGPESVALTDSVAAAPADSLTPALATVSYSGVPFGPLGLWDGPTGFEWGPAPFTTSQDNTFAESIITRINTARNKRQRLILAMTGGNSSQFKTNGKFDLTKWKNRMNTFKTAAIKSAVAAAVADGTVIGNSIMDEPETKQWGGVMTKPLLDNMASYVKAIFPTLPVGVNHGAPGYAWRTNERYRVVDYTTNQYQWMNNNGQIAKWRDAVLSRASVEGIKVAFSVNLLNGGVPDNSGTWDCSGTGGKGTIAHRCRMTSTQVRDWGKLVGPSGCFMMMWRYDGAFMAKAANVDAFRDVASVLAGKPRKSCKRA